MSRNCGATSDCFWFCPGCCPPPRPSLDEHGHEYEQTLLDLIPNHPEQETLD